MYAKSSMKLFGIMAIAPAITGLVTVASAFTVEKWKCLTLLGTGEQNPFLEKRDCD